MEAGTIRTTMAARRYAAALLDLAEQAGAIPSVEADLKDLRAMIAGSGDLRRLLASPIVSRGKKREAVLALAAKAKFHQLTTAFLGVLADNRRLPETAAILNAAAAALAARRGEITAGVQTAFALSDAQTKALKESIGKALGSSVTLNVEIDRSLIGGMIVTVGSKMIDDSVRRKLERLGRAMKSGTGTA